MAMYYIHCAYLRTKKNKTMDNASPGKDGLQIPNALVPSLGACSSCSSLNMRLVMKQNRGGLHERGTSEGRYRYAEVREL
ncbi:hypothetical protein N7532_006693 [Penicillium argentinense]|uniref:Uncharacterized protein n=1 Tax=Penicillium argentinense TaxID=1131581 RepID=A0A9W9KC76_9EURO|nr:uncharacterized protein N7532_006693 [Penicillium argentinense]KAJ5099692.1 hypothetical protein N7532_006693 [Penicillium argentinense]